MGGDLSDHRNEHDKLEVRMASLEAEVKLQAGLRADMDEELGDIPAKLNAHQESLTALREVQAEHTQRLTRIEGAVGNTELAIGYLNGRMDLLERNLGGRMDRLDSRMDDLDSRIGGLDGRMDLLERNLGGRMDSLESQMSGVKAGVDEILERLGKG